jgi:hypothetical protein
MEKDTKNISSENIEDVSPTSLNLSTDDPVPHTEEGFTLKSLYKRPDNRSFFQEALDKYGVRHYHHRRPPFLCWQLDLNSSLLVPFIVRWGHRSCQGEEVDPQNRLPHLARPRCVLYLVSRAVLRIHLAIRNALISHSISQLDHGPSC